MIKHKISILLALILISGLAILLYLRNNPSKNITNVFQTNDPNFQIEDGGLTDNLHELSIEYLRNGEYPGSDITVEQNLESASSYNRYLASYRSEGLKIFALLTVPSSIKPDGGWPAIIFNHGYIQPSLYLTTEKYVAYIDGFARNGFIVFKPDFRGHGNSEGQATGAYGSSDYTIDALNAVASVKKLKDANGERIGMWGHSMGGFITLRSMVVDQGIKAGVIWAGVVGSYSDLLDNWRRRPFSPPPLPSGARRWRQTLLEFNLG